MINNKTVSGILLIAGNSTRFNGNTNKNLQEIDDKPIFLYSLDVFNSNKYIDNIFIVIKESEKETIGSVINNYKGNIPISLVIGRK